MLRDICPFCKRQVAKTDKDTMLSVNGRGSYKTMIYFHRSCYDRMVEDNYKKSDRDYYTDMGKGLLQI